MADTSQRPFHREAFSDQLLNQRLCTLLNNFVKLWLRRCLATRGSPKAGALLRGAATRLRKPIMHVLKILSAWTGTGHDFFKRFWKGPRVRLSGPTQNLQQGLMWPPGNIRCWGSRAGTYSSCSDVPASEQSAAFHTSSCYKEFVSGRGLRFPNNDPLSTFPRAVSLLLGSSGRAWRTGAVWWPLGDPGPDISLISTYELSRSNYDHALHCPDRWHTEVRQWIKAAMPARAPCALASPPLALLLGGSLIYP